MFVCFIIAIALFIIKILIEYPGLLELNLTNSESTENLVVYSDQGDIELGDVTRDVTKERDKKKERNEKLKDKNHINNMEEEELDGFNIESEKAGLLVNIQ